MNTLEENRMECTCIGGEQYHQREDCPRHSQRVTVSLATKLNWEHRLSGQRNALKHLHAELDAAKRDAKAVVEGRLDEGMVPPGWVQTVMRKRLMRDLVKERDDAVAKLKAEEFSFNVDIRVRLQMLEELMVQANQDRTLIPTLINMMQSPELKNYACIARRYAKKPEERFVVTVQRINGITPVEHTDKAERERDAAVAELREFQAKMRRRSERGAFWENANALGGRLTPFDAILGHHFDRHDVKREHEARIMAHLSERVRLPEIPCENAFNRWATDDPERLLDFVADHARAPHLLTFAAEILGRSEAPVDKSEAVLVATLKHAHPTVREGAILGLNELTWRVRLQLETLDIVERMAVEDPSPGVRAVCDGQVAHWREMA